MVSVAVQIGFQKSYKETARVDAKLNDRKISWEKFNATYNGEFLTPTSDRRAKCWFLALLNCEDGDIIDLNVSVFLAGRGPDEDRTRTVRFTVSEASEPEEYSIQKVGERGYPLVSGKVIMSFEKKLIQDRMVRADGVIELTRE